MTILFGDFYRARGLERERERDIDRKRKERERERGVDGAVHINNFHFCFGRFQTERNVQTFDQTSTSSFIPLTSAFVADYYY